MTDGNLDFEKEETIDYESAASELVLLFELPEKTKEILTSGDYESAASELVLLFELPEKTKEILTSGVSSNAIYLDTIASLLLEPNLTLIVAELYYPELLSLVLRFDSIKTEKTKEIICALAILLPLAPFLKSYVVKILNEFPSFFCIFNVFYDMKVQYKEEETDFTTQELLLAAYRLIIFDPVLFSPFISVSYIWPCLHHQARIVRFFAVEILCILLFLSDVKREELISFYVGQDPVDYLYFGKTIDFSFFLLFENELKMRFLDKVASRNYFSKNGSRVIHELDQSHLMVSMCGVSLLKLNSLSSIDSGFVITPSSRKNLRKFTRMLLVQKPILLLGPIGSGKTFMVESVTKMLGNYDNLIRIYLGDQTDIKSLIGTYVIGSKPGAFDWKPGVLTRAVQEGRYVLIEDIDKASNEVISVLLPLLEKNELQISNRGEKIVAALGFQIIATISMNIFQKNDIKFLGSRLWEIVNIDEIPLTELSILICSKFQILRKLCQKIIEVYEAVVSIYNDSVFHSVSKIAFGRIVSIRDLMKWCKRMSIFLNNSGIALEDDYISQNVIDNMFYNSVDCFSGMIQTDAGKSLIVQKIAQILGYLSNWADAYIKSYIPAYEDLGDCIKIGRVRFQKKLKFDVSRFNHTFAFTSSVLKLLEQLGVSIECGEHILLVGETGTGKTTVVQYLANVLGHELVIINMSQQTENTDLVGGFKPIDLKTVSVSLKNQFDHLFGIVFSVQKNSNFLEAVQKAYSSKKWKYMIRLFKAAIDMARKRISSVDNDKKNNKIFDISCKKRCQFGPELKQKLEVFSEEVSRFENYILEKSESFVFDFVEGPLIKAIQNGSWILLDEINLAEFGILEGIGCILQENGSIILSEKGDIEPIRPHPDFRLFACMNPSTDIGRSDLSLSLRSRFTEFFVYSPDQNFDDLLTIIYKYIGNLCCSDDKIPYDVAHLHLKAKQLADENYLVDSAGQKPHYSIRTLTRTLVYVNEICQLYELRRSLYEGFCMLYLTLLERRSEETLHVIIKQYTLGRVKNIKSLLSQVPKKPLNGDYIQFKHYWMPKGNYEVQKDDNYIITQSVEKNMLNLIRAISIRKFPILVQGHTSSGKTSMIEYISKLTGHKFVRINNHEHIDLQEYLGAYISDDFGNLKFKEGVMVEALRNGYWIVLDELNLAPSDVLEALNRLLDDNRELFIPETQEIVKPHPHFMLFATQNPPGIYGGRKYLSRAFRNRFLELHYDNIPENELETILCNRCHIPPSYAMKMVQVYKKLSLQRQSSKIFQQKNSFMTLRDLFRWASREFSTYQEFVNNGYMLLGERMRRNDEKSVVKETIETVMKVKIDENELYGFDNTEECSLPYCFPNLEGIVWTKSMKRLFRLVSFALKNNEPVLLVGDTGTGKTSICQAIAKSHSLFLHIVNVHQNTESSDIIGAQRPIRNKDIICKRLSDNIFKLMTYLDSKYFDDNQSSSFSDLIAAFSSLKINNIKEELKDTVYSHVISCIEKDIVQYKKMFDWCDGALIKAMKSGEYFLLDEISLADDSVLERLNSVLESSRTITLAEKSVNENLIKAKDGFKFMATMNPGGDYGKKELSPALRNRFTEIWVPSIFDEDDILKIVRSKLRDDLCQYSSIIVSFSFWFQQKFSFNLSGSLSIRDILLWVDYINLSDIHTSASLRILHGAALVYIDKIGVNNGLFSKLTAEEIRNKRLESVKHLSNLIGKDLQSEFLKVPSVFVDKEMLKIGPFSFLRGSDTLSCSSYSLSAPTTSFNAMRILRAIQMSRPILLEGDPGVGKTSLISAIASIAGFQLTRINLSEQTDLMDLFGSDLPVDGETAEFSWHDGPFLHAMKNGHWVLLDEMNLAPQSILEGLNACFDHRLCAFIPELNQTFVCHPSFRVFAAQNPYSQGGGRKCLPKSFINRFVVVYVEKMSFEDLLFICDYIFPNEDPLIKKKIILFIERLNNELSLNSSFGALGSPWEFNLRDIFRWLEILQCGKSNLHGKCPSEFLDIIVKQRFRTVKDQKIVDEIYQEIFGNIPVNRNLYYSFNTNFFQVGHALLPRNPVLRYNKGSFFSIFKNQLKVIESLISCIQFNWPCILVGPPASGKTSLIRFISFISGTRLVEFSVNNDVDTMDIIGGFEQVDLILKLNKFITDVNEFCKDKLRSLLISREENMKRVSLYSRVLELIKIQGRQTISDYRKLLSDMNLLFTELSTLSITYDSSFQKIFERLKKYVLVDDTYKPTQFEWVDSILVQAVKNGDWLLLDNANLCNSSVLDRLNSLMEPKGCLVLNERNSVDGKPLLINSHPNFRIILTMDPANGELSRAMRNRCVEIFCDKSHFDNQVKSTVALPMFPKPSHDDSVFFSILPSSIFNHFYLYGKILKKYCSEKNIYALGSLFLEYIPIKYINLLKRWYSTYIINSGMFSQINENIVLNLMHKCTEFRKSFLYQRIYDFYKDAIHRFDFFEEFIDMQPLFPLVNQYVKNIFLDSSVDSNSSWICSMYIKLGYMYNMFSKYLDLKIIFENIQKKSLDISNANMTILEKMCSNLRFDEINVLPHINIFQFLSSLLNEIGFLLIQENLDYVNQEFTEGVLDLIGIWRHIYELTNVQSIDYSKYHVYSNNLQIWSKKYLSLFPLGSREHFHQLISLFNLNFELETGFSMKIIWEKVRPNIPKFEYTWSIYKELISCMDRFDRSLQYNAYMSSVISSIRFLFLENCYSIFSVSDNIGENLLKNNSFQTNFKIEDFIKDLENNMNKIDSYNDNNINVIFSCLEGYVIDYILKFGFISKELYDMMVCLHAWTDKSSISLIPYVVAYKGALTNESLVSQVFDSYFSISNRCFASSEYLGSLIESSAFLFFGRPIKTIAISIYDMKNVLFENFEQMKFSLSHLTSQIFRCTWCIKSDKVGSIVNILIEKFVQIFDIHKFLYYSSDYHVILTSLRKLSEFGCYGNGKENIKLLEQLRESFQKTNHQKLKTIIEMYFMPSLMAVFFPENLKVTEAELMLKLGRAFIFFELGFLYLYVPNIPYDPAIFSIVQADLYEKELNDISNEIYLRKLYENEFTGCNDNLSIENLQMRYQNLESKKVAFPCVYRPSVPEISGICQEFEKLLEMFVFNHSLEDIIKDFENKEFDFVVRLNTAQKTIIQLIRRFESHLYYTDILKPICGSLKVINFSLVLIKQAEQFSKCTSEDLTMKMFLNLLDITTIFTEPPSVAFVTMFLKEASSYKLSSIFIDRFMIFYFKKLCFFKRYSFLDESSDYMEVADYIFRYFYSKWLVRRDEKIKLEQEKESVYKIAHVEEDMDYQALFPEFENLNEFKEYKHSEIDQDFCYVELMRIHRKFFNESELPVSCFELINSALSLGMELLTLENFNISSKANEIVLSSLIYYMKNVLNDANFILSVHQDSSNRVYNFYKDSNIEESVKLCSVLKDLKCKVQQFLEEWPENFILHEIMTRSDIILKLGIEVPLARSLIALEQLYSTVDQWRLVESSKCSLDANMEDLRDLIIKWRKFELSCWNDLFNLEDKEKCNEVAVWWFYLYENLIYRKSESFLTGDLEKYMNELVSLLDQFIISSPLGQFEERLKLIGVFSNHLAILGKTGFLEKKTLLILKNLVGLYSLYIPKIRNAIHQGRIPLEASIKETVKLASWKDINVFALRESTRKSHRSLYKVVKKYRELLSTSSLPILTEPFVESLSLNFKSDNFYDSLELKLISTDEELLKWSLDHFNSVSFIHRLDAPYRHRNILNTVQNMWFLVIKKYVQDSISNENPFELFTINVVENMKELQNLTSVFISSDKELEISYLKTRKRRLFSDTLTELKRIGLKTNPSAAVIKEVSNVHSLLTTIPYYDKNSKGINDSPIEIIDEYFYRFITLIINIRRRQNECSSDISMNEITRSLGLLNSLFYMILVERSSLIKTLFKIQNLEEKISVLSLLQSMVFEDNVLFVENYRKNKYIYDKSESILIHIQNIVRVLENIRATHSDIASFPLLDELGKDFNLVSEESNKFIAEFKCLSGLDRVIMDKTAETFVSDFMIWMEKILNKMLSYSIQSASSAYLVTPILNWMKDTMESLKLIQFDSLENDSNKVSIEFDIFMRNISDKVLLIIQNLVDAKSLDTKHSSDGILEDAWLLKKHEFFLASLNTLEMKNMNSLLGKSIIEIKKLNVSGFSNIRVLFDLKATCCLSVPILEQYLMICKYVLGNFINHHKSMTKSALLFSIVLNTLIEKGFCAPSEKSFNEKNTTISGEAGLPDDDCIGDFVNNVDNIEHFENFEDSKDMNPERNNFKDFDDNVKEVDDFDDGVSESICDSQINDSSDDRCFDDEISQVYDQNCSINRDFWDNENNEFKNLDSVDDQKLDNNNAQELDNNDVQKLDNNNAQELDNNDVQELDNNDAQELDNNDVQKLDNNDVQKLDNNNAQKLDNDESKTECVAQEYEENVSLFKENFDINDEKDDNEIFDNEVVENIQENAFDDNKEHVESLEFADYSGLDDNNNDVFDSDMDLDNQLDLDQESKCEESNFVDDCSEHENNHINESEITPDNEFNEVTNNMYKKDKVDNENQNDSTSIETEIGSNTYGNYQVPDNFSENHVIESGFSHLNEGFHREFESGGKNDMLGAVHGFFSRSGFEKSFENDTRSQKNDNDEHNNDEYDSSNPKIGQELESIKSLNDSCRNLGNTLEQWNRVINSIFDSRDFDLSDNNKSLKDSNEYEYIANDNIKEDAEILSSLSEKQEKKDYFGIEKNNLYNINSYYNDANIEKSNDSSVDPKLISISKFNLETLYSETDCQKINTKQNMNDNFLQNTADLNETSLEYNCSFDLLGFNPSTLDSISDDDAMHLWRSHEESVHDLSVHLCEQLKLILEPTLATKMQGDYRTGKRLNMKRIIPYISSQYRKDKIWMRRTKPSKRQYQVMICIDDSKSMAESGSISLTFETLAVISKALTLLEVGEICIMSFGEKPLLIHSFKEPFTSESGAKLIKKFKFNQSITDVKALTEMSIKLLEAAKNASYSKSRAELWQLEIIISDGIYEDHDSLRRLLRKAYELKIMVIFVIVDVIHGEKKTSLLDMKQVRYKSAPDGSELLEIINYMDEFAFDHFIIVRDVKELTYVLVNALRQWFMEISHS
ncbi:hypothetical protein PORY_002442 [Pneumocystis oryctolagi]|uniref:Uncharacterized protein n=1 Tax=Pneumocystis oryctolagi TaxID=42067 RepID=A0ACB7C971_9ASCO|nr:hypothetical protein PORY_002442 [Pneumocystis oryctolagi]